MTQSFMKHKFFTRSWSCGWVVAESVYQSIKTRMQRHAPAEIYIFWTIPWIFPRYFKESWIIYVCKIYKPGCVSCENPEKIICSKCSRTRRVQFWQHFPNSFAKSPMKNVTPKNPPKCFFGHIECSFDNRTGNFLLNHQKKLRSNLKTFILFFSKASVLEGCSGLVECSFPNRADTYFTGKAQKVLAQNP